MDTLEPIPGKILVISSEMFGKTGMASHPRAMTSNLETYKLTTLVSHSRDKAP